jgi:hypothetical protein
MEQGTKVIKIKVSKKSKDILKEHQQQQDYLLDRLNQVSNQLNCNSARLRHNTTLHEQIFHKVWLIATAFAVGTLIGILIF